VRAPSCNASRLVSVLLALLQATSERRRRLGQQRKGLPFSLRAQGRRGYRLRLAREAISGEEMCVGHRCLQNRAWGTLEDHGHCPAHSVATPNVQAYI
jgi:hypothetical protein